jgi:predicted RND superfamily exporter protein
LFAGYFLMLFGELKTVLYFGILTSISIVAALVSQLFLFPILLAKFDK